MSQITVEANITINISGQKIVISRSEAESLYNGLARALNKENNSSAPKSVFEYQKMFDSQQYTLHPPYTITSQN